MSISVSNFIIAFICKKTLWNTHTLTHRQLMGEVDGMLRKQLIYHSTDNEITSPRVQRWSLKEVTVKLYVNLKKNSH